MDASWLEEPEPRFAGSGGGLLLEAGVAPAVAKVGCRRRRRV